MPESQLDSTIKYIKTYAPAVGKYAYASARSLGWIVITTTIITFMPLWLETMREAEIEAIEASTIQEGLSKGESPIQLANMKGLSAAIEPDVLKD